MTIGARGALVWEGAGVTHVPAPVVSVVDTTGAGDTFIGALADALSRGEALLRAAVWAVHAGGRPRCAARRDDRHARPRRGSRLRRARDWTCAGCLTGRPRTSGGGGRPPRMTRCAHEVPQMVPLRRSRRMKKRVVSGLAVASVALLGLTACSSSSSTASRVVTSSGASSRQLRHVGRRPPVGRERDQRRARRPGLLRRRRARHRGARGKPGSKTLNIQADANNPAQWRSNLESVSDGKWDIVITGHVADGRHPQRRRRRSTPSRSTSSTTTVVDQPNVASIVYKQNEGSFLAGVLAGAGHDQTRPTFPLASGTKKPSASSVAWTSR